MFLSEKKLSLFSGGTKKLDKPKKAGSFWSIAVMPVGNFSEVEAITNNLERINTSLPPLSGKVGQNYMAVLSHQPGAEYSLKTSGWYGD